MSAALASSLRGRQRQRGAATLVVVMLLFFVISLTAAYTARNLIFEQRTGANQYRGSQSIEAAQAGLEWVTGMLNGGLVDDACVPISAPIPAGATSFRQRFLAIDPGTGMVTPRLRSSGSSLWAACQFDGAAWVCSCPSDDAPNLTPPAVAGSYPAFGVRFVPSATSKPGIQRVEVNGCNSFDLECITKVAPDTAYQCRGMLCSLVALYNGVRVIPPATLTAGGQLNGSALRVTNADLRTGITVHTGHASALSPPALQLTGPPGTPPLQTLADDDHSLDSSLPGSPMAADSDSCVLCLFSSVFGVQPSTYREQPAVIGAVELDCTTACTAAQVNQLVALNPGRMIWLQGAGGLSLDTATDIGSAAAPVVLVVRGPFAVNAGATVYGLVFANSASLNGGNPVRGTLQGALVSVGDVTATGANTQLVYDAAALTTLMQTTGSFVRVSGSWRDFK